MSSRSNATLERLAAVLATLIVAALTALAAAGTARGALPPQQGLTVGEWGPSAYGPVATQRTLVAARRRGVNSVTLFTTWMQDDERAIRIAPGQQTVRPSRLAAAIRTARRLRLQVVLRPYVDLRNRGWRGDARPRDLARWWGEYRRFILRYARLGARAGATAFVVGSEMKSQSGRDAMWRALVADVRRVFRGAVTYEANWDEFEGVTWWDALDAIDISGYFPIATRAGAPVEELAAGWAPPMARIAAVQARFGLPVMLGEVGYTSESETAIRPWKVAPGGTTAARWQADAYEATFRAWAGVPWFAGMHWWFMPTRRSLVGRLPGHQHIPRAAALRVLARHYLER